MTQRRSSAQHPDVAEIRAEKHARLRQMIDDHMAKGVGLDAAIGLVVEQTGRGRSTLYTIWKSRL